MDTLITAVALVALTAAFAWWHVRRSREGPGEAPETGPRRACPRCGTALGEADSRCPACGVPMQVYELVSAPVVDPSRVAEDPAQPPHPVVRTDLCVGCGACVSVCPEPGALRLVAQKARVDLDVCRRHGLCAPACPVGAIVMASGAAVQRILVPEVDAHFESAVPGLYVVGELGGRGLIKNAINEGRVAVEHVARALASRAGRPAGVHDLAIVGSGPAGLSAALEAGRLGLDCVVLEQGSLSDTIRKYPRRKLLLAEPSNIEVYGGLWVSNGSKEELLQVWQTMIARAGLRVLTGERVEAIEREEDGFRLGTASGSHRARRVVLAMGRRGTPRRLGVPGEELEKALYDIVEMETFADGRVLVVGGGDSAVESAVGVAAQRGTTVTLSHRGDDFARVQPRNREKLEEARGAGRVEVLLRSRVLEIRPDEVAVEVEGAPRAIPNDWVVIRIGGEPAYPFLERCGVRIVSKEIPLEPKAARTGP